MVFSFCIMFNTFCDAQNLVPNPSFEDTLECPSFTGYIETTCAHWFPIGNYSPNSGMGIATPDYYNACAPVWILQVPYNMLGYQQAKTGQAYMGAFTYSAVPSTPAYYDYREYIGVQLINPLVAGQKYYVSFYAVSAYNPPPYNDATAFSNNIGARFSVDGKIYGEIAPNNAQINRQEILADSINWALISGSFIADSAYNYLAIGNFFDNAHTDTIQFQYPGKQAYYYIDDVCVTADSGNCNEFFNDIRNSDIAETKLFPNPATNNLFLNSNDFIKEIRAYNSLGNIAFIREVNAAVEHLCLDVTNLTSGLYYFIIIQKNLSIYHQTIIIYH